MRTYYFPIKSECLAHYFGCACLKPSKYFTNKLQDIQNLFENFLLITTNRGCIECNCCLEIVLTNEEEAKLISVGRTWYLFESSLPITRVKKIFFTEEQQKNKTLTNIRMGTAFIPDSIIGTVCCFEDVTVNEVKKPEDCYVKDQTKEIELYDRILGALIIMRLAREKYMNFSETYIETLAVFNNLIADALVKAGKGSNDQYSGLFTESKSYACLLPYLNKQVDVDDVKQMAKNEGQTVSQNKITRKIELDSLDKQTYILAVLASYGVGSESKRDKVDGLILSNFEGIKSAQLVALCFGYNRGYNVFSSFYGTSEGNRIDVKFLLDSQLDYYTVESVYQFVFNKKISKNLYYLDSWCSKQRTSSIIKKTDYCVLDTIVIGKKKPKVGSKEWWSSLSQFYQRIDVSSLFQTPLSTLFKKVADHVIQECNEEKEEEIAEIKAQYEGIKSRLMELKKTMENLSLNQRESSTNEERTGDVNREDIIKEVFGYFDKNDKELNAILKSLGINSKGLKKNEKIFKILNAKEQNIFEKN
ncbi:hypothetical protein [Parabacteroides sp. ZJ-118]|uniref:hypothetical protein n=1 Tax=Parabacteroides sp. ZJ-118 TaxID=2709398 RepID=UPI0013EC6F58|nr:hypothetical protein [Parabacteroides sp. ZJ-118]